MMSFLRLLRAFGAVCLLLMAGSPVAADELDEAIAQLKKIGHEGEGNAAAVQAYPKVAQVDAGQLPRLLTAINDADPMAANWLRGAVDTVAERTIKQGGKLPAKELEAFALDRKNSPNARRLAYDWLVKVDSTASERLVPGMIDDPAPRFRRDAVQQIIDKADKLLAADDKQQAAEVYQQALAAARDVEQVDHIADRLKKLEVPVDLADHFGFIMSWKLLAPFDNEGESGFAAVYPPENGVDIAAEYQGKLGPIRWQDHETEDSYGKVDLNKFYDRSDDNRTHKGAVAYAFHVFTSDQARPAELRLGCKNAWKVWVNGELVFAREEYHRGMRMDQYTMPVNLAKGHNTILLKICQNEMTQSWAQDWNFQIRVTDATGTAILSQTRGQAVPSDYKP